MNRRITVVLLALVLGLGAAACGGGDDNGTDTTPDGTVNEAGKAVFVANCGTCHTLSDAGTTGTIGPGLDDIALSEAAIEEQVREGGGGMPAFEGQLDDQEITDVAEYVVDASQP